MAASCADKPVDSAVAMLVVVVSLGCIEVRDNVSFLESSGSDADAAGVSVVTSDDDVDTSVLRKTPELFCTFGASNDTPLHNNLSVISARLLEVEAKEGDDCSRQHRRRCPDLPSSDSLSFCSGCCTSTTSVASFKMDCLLAISSLSW